MTGAAWLMLALTWGAITALTVRFFWKVATLPRRDEEGDAGEGARRTGPER